MTADTDYPGQEPFMSNGHTTGSDIPPRVPPVCNGGTNEDSQSPASVPLAIVGMSCRFAGDATSPSKLWDLCVDGKSAWSPIPADRFDADAIYDPDPDKPGRHHVRGGHFLKEDPANFDAAFFNLSSDIADAMDPQLRLLLESVYEATEDAGLPLHKLSGTNTSVTAGCFNRDYYELLMRDVETMPRHTMTSTGMTMLCNRVSYFYNLHGPSMAVDTACSTGLVALNQGCQTIWMNQSEIAIVGASCALLSPDMFIGESIQGVLGSEGKCFALDDRAAGYGRGEGVASLILKRLDTALRDGDRVHAVIREMAVNQDGRTPTITSPSVDAQERLIRDCYARAGLDMKDTAFVEGHLTGTSVGDPIEAEAISRTFGKSRTAGAPPVLVGSVKTNLGHTEPVSGLASLIRTVFVLKAGLIPPHVNFKTPNPKIPLEEWNLAVATSVTSWPEGFPYRASVNNFGYGGTNAHVILERAPDAISQEAHISPASTNGNRTGVQNGDQYGDNDTLAPGNDPTPSYVFVTSAKDAAAAESTVRRLADHLDSVIGTSEEPSPRDLAFTLSERRTRFSWATAFRARTLSELVGQCRQPGVKPTHSMRTPRIGYVLNGNGAQWYGMGRELLAAYPVFAQSVGKADAVHKKTGASWSLRDELLRTEPPPVGSSHDNAENQVRLSVVVSALQIALVDLLASWGIRPSGVASHSMGEMPAAYAVGALTLEQAMGITLLRCEIFLRHGTHVSGGGAMLAAGIGPEGAAAYISKLTCGGRLTVACVNSPASVTLSGDVAAIDEIEVMLKQDEIFARKLNVPIAFHSHFMLPVAQEYNDRLSTLLPETCYWVEDGPVFASPVTGGIMSPRKGLPFDHWVRNLLQPTLFSSALEAMVYGTSAGQSSGPPQQQVDFIVEIGAHSQLAAPIRQTLSQNGTASIPYASCLKRSANAVDTMHDLAASLVSHGYVVDLAAVNSPYASSPPPSFVSDLPSYPWNHSKRYWSSASRLVHEYKFPRHPAHELLGLPLAGSSPLAPIWRNFLRLTDESIPWLADHQLEGTVVFPGAGYVAMAIEAVRMVVDPSEAGIQAYKLRDVEIVQTLQVPDSSTGVEVLFQMERCSDKELDSDGWWEFRVCSAQPPSRQAGNVTCLEHCRGSVYAEKTSMTGTRKDWRKQDKLDSVQDDGLAFLGPDAEAHAVNVDVDQLFAGMREMGIYHGPSFQNLTAARAAFDERKVVCDFAISGAASLTNPVATKNRREYPIHPTTLDSAFQAGYAALDDNMRQDWFYVPRSIGAMYVPKAVKRSGGHRLRALTELTSTKAGRGFMSTVTIVDADGNVRNDTSSAIHIEKLYCQAVSRDTTDRGDSFSPYPACGKVTWVPDVLQDMPASIKDSMRIRLTDEEVDWEARIRRGSYYYIRDAVSQLQCESEEEWAWHHKKLMAWMKMVMAGSESTYRTWADAYNSSSAKTRHEFLDQLSSDGVTGELLCRVGARLADIIRGQVTPLELMTEDGLLGRYYEALPPSVRSNQHVQTVVSLFAAKNPGARVLEIGAGTGGATTTVLAALSGTDAEGNNAKPAAPGFAHYDFTDVSAGFFDAARHKFALWDSQGLMSFKRLDIETDPETQPEFGPDSTGTYDLVISSLVLHATTSLDRTMRNVRKLLRPGGTLVMVEGTNDRLDSHVLFGTLPGWWLSEEPDRGMSPMVSLDYWDRILRATGFAGGVEFELGDCESEDYQSCSVVATTATSGEKMYPQSFTLVYADAPPPDEWLAQIRDMVRSRTGADVHLESLAALDSGIVEDKVCLFVGEMQGPIIHEMDSETFNRVRRLLVDSRGVLWVTCGGTADAAWPELALAQGVLRTVREEDQSKRCILLDFEQTDDTDIPWTSDRARSIADILQASFDFGANLADFEFEYTIRDSIPHVPRVLPDATLDETHTEAVEPFWEPVRDLVLRCNMSGSLSGMHFVDASAMFAADLPTGLIEIEPRAFGLNFRDVLTVLGEVDGPTIGQECSGIITRLGPGTAESGLRVGDRVCALSTDSWGTKQRARWQCTERIPDSLSWAEASIIPIAYVTAWITLRESARLRKGENVLVHAATGGFGQAVLAMAQYMGAGTIFATCGTSEKRDLLVCEYGLDDGNIFSSRNDDFASAIMEKTGGKGVDIVVNSLAGPLFKASWDIIARNGRLVDVGKRDSQAGRHLDMSPFRRCATITAIDLAVECLDEREGGRPYLMREAFPECVKLVAERSVRLPVPLTEYPMSEMEKAMRLMQAGNHLGKIVLVPKPDDLVKVASQPQPVELLQDATYLIAGGARGIGASIAKWMVERGAKHLVLVSRNARGSADASALVQMALEKECDMRLHNCDIGDEKAFLSFVATCRESLPRIRGIITGAMVLDDTILESMTYAQWQMATRPKVAGTMNLHRYLGDDVDFFIMLSSLVGVTGNTSQANYAAGNAFQDALARNRTSHGKPAVTLDLGVVADVGYLATADQAIVDRTISLFGGKSIDVAQTILLIEDAVRHPLRTGPDAAQVLVGIPRNITAPDSCFSRDKRFLSLRMASGISGLSQGAPGSSATQIPLLLERLTTKGSSLTLDEVTEITSSLVTLKLCEIFSLAAEEIDISLPLGHYGVDSLVGVELRNWLGSAVKAKVTIFEILQSPSVTEFAGLVAGRTKGSA